MPFIYKPLRQYMTPNDTTIDTAIDNVFDTIINGSQCVGYRFLVYTMQNDRVTNASSNLMENTYKYYVVTNINTANNTITVSTNDLQDGDAITLETTGTLPSPLRVGQTYYIGDFLFGRFSVYNTQTEAITGTNPIDITDVGVGYQTVRVQSDLYNGESLSVTVPANTLEPGNNYKWQIELFANRFNTNASSGNSSITATNHNLSTGDMVYIINSAEGTNVAGFTCYYIYYVRKIDKDHLALFNNIEGARNDAGRVTPNATTMLTMSNVAISEQVPFDAYDAPTLTLESVTITQQSHTFRPVYYHPQGVMIQNFRALMRNGGGLQRSENVPTSEQERDSGLQENIRLEWTFDGLLSGNVYLVKFIVTTKTDQIVETDWVNFPVDYPTPDLGVAPEATNHPEISAVILEWAGIVQVVGDNVGEMDFVPNFGVVGNWGLKMEPYSRLIFSNLDIRLGSSPPMFWWQPTNSNFRGVIMRTENSLTGDHIEVGYNGTNFYKEVNGIVFNNAPMTISNTNIYFIAVTLDELFITSIYAPEMEGFITSIGEEFLVAPNNDSLYVVKPVDIS